MKLGLTGGIACGKTTASAVFAEHGFVVIDTDEIGHELLNSDSNLISNLVSRFGQAILSNNAVNRTKLAEIIFNDPSALDYLESQIHPPIIATYRKLLRNSSPNANILVQIPLLFEKKLESDFDYTICLSSSYEVQLQRLISKGLSKADADQRINRQLPIQKKAEKADFIIYNNTTIDDLRHHVLTLIQKLNSL